MSTIGSYKNTAFSEGQKFLVLDPETGSTSLVRGSSLVDYIAPRLNSVIAESTRLATENTDYDIGTLIQTSGAESPGDNFAATYLVVGAGEGDFPMINGNELLVIKGDEFLREQLATAETGNGSDLVVKPDTGETVTAELDKRTIYVGSVAELESLSAASGQNVYLTVAGKGGDFVFMAGDRSSEVSGDPEQGVWISGNSDATGANGAWMRQFDGLSPNAGYCISWFGGVSDRTVTDNSAAIQAAYDYAATRSKVVRWDGQYGFSSTINVPFSTFTLGAKGQERSSTNTPEAEMVWNGGASPMISMTDTRIGFEGLTVTNLGSATDWIYMGEDSQRLFLEWIFCSGNAPNNKFSRSFVKSDGNRIGYSQFSRLYINNAPAPKVFDVSGSSTTVGITTIALEKSIISNSQTDEMDVFSFDGFNVEVVNIDRNTFIDRGPGMRVVDTSLNPPADGAIYVLNIRNNEFEARFGADGEMLNLHNVLSCNFDGNHCDGNGNEPRFGRLVNSNITSFDGNLWQQFTSYFWDADDDSLVCLGFNGRSVSPLQWASHDNADSGIRRFILDPSLGANFNLPTQRLDSRAHGIIEVDVTGTGTYNLRAANVQGRAMPPGIVFTVVLRNVSGGAISDPLFSGQEWNIAGGFTAPSDGFNKALTVYFNGAKCVELGRRDTELANA